MEAIDELYPINYVDIWPKKLGFICY